MNPKRESDYTFNETTSPSLSDFIRTIINKDIKANKNEGRVITRFPPEPNGYLHIGHAKAICINFGIAKEFGGTCNLRFDDTNPTKENIEYVRSIKEDILWLGFDWADRLYYSSDYFDKLKGFAVKLIKLGEAYVCDLSAEETKEFRGTLTEPGRESPYRNRSVEENLDLFMRMENGEFEEGSRVLRAKINMASGNLNMRDPVIYRIIKTPHHRTGKTWCIYPMYDFAQGQSDSIEGVTHSLCSLEFEDHRALYDWLLEKLDIFHPQQIEFARLNLTHTVLSKRMLIQLVNEGHVSGWDDPRMPTLSGMRRRGYTPEAIRDFCDQIGVAKRTNNVDIAVLENSVRDDLNRRTQRAMGVLDPLHVVIENYPEGQIETLDAVNNPEDTSTGMREIPFSRELYIERADFSENPPRKFFRLAPGKEVRLRYGYFITCVDVVKDKKGTVTELRCTYDPETKGGQAPDGRKVRGTIHWVSAQHSIPAKINLYDYLFTAEQPVEESPDFKESLNPKSLTTLTSCRVEPGLADALPGTTYQFERQGYFCVDTDSIPSALIFNRTVPLRDSWAKIKKKSTNTSQEGPT